MTVNIEGLGEITASKEVLNQIALAFSSACELERSKNRDALANKNYTVFISLYDSLDDTGYYEY